MRILFERPFVSGDPLSSDTLLDDAFEYDEAWKEKVGDLGDLGDLGDVEPFVIPGDPQDVEPANAWLLKGTEPSFPSQEALLDEAARGQVGVFDFLWTAAKQTEVGDLALIYFMTPRKAVHFVTRAASRAFFDRSIQVVADGKVADEQWWAYFTPPVEIDAIPLALLRQQTDGHLPLRGRSGLFLRPDTIAALPMRAKRSEDQAALDRVLVTPVGRADLPQPEEVTMDIWPHLASWPRRLEADVSQYLVEPLLRSALRGTNLNWAREYPVGRKSADYVVLDSDGPRCVIEVKLAIHEDLGGVWVNSNDLIQMRGYADALGCLATRGVCPHLRSPESRLARSRRRRPRTAREIGTRLGSARTDLDVWVAPLALGVVGDGHAAMVFQTGGMGYGRSRDC